MSNRRNKHFGDRKMYKAVCSDCNQECEVPFKPDGERPVYCRECYKKHRKKY
jgi:CxxC-x17-CxxC domain-containing protein